jgi:hypothetical protein
MSKLATNTQTTNRINSEILPELLRKINALPDAGSGGNEAVIEALNITENGTYNATETVDGYAPITVNVPIPDGYIQPEGTKTITENGIFDVAPFASANVNVPTGGGFPNGTEWTQSNITSGYFRTVYNANGIWVAGGEDNEGLYYSEDGKVWTQSNRTSGYFHTVYNANGIWVVGSYYGSKGLYYSEDGKTWTKSNITSGNCSSAYNANGIWVVGRSEMGLYYSEDGKVWTQSNITSGSSHAVYNANGIWVAGRDGTGLYYSEDGKVWTQSNITSGDFATVYNANGIWVVGSGSDRGLYYSVTWEPK